MNNDNKINEEELKNIDEEKAKELYYVHFWVPPECEEINGDRIAIKLFDMCVNFGVNGGAKVIQRAVNANYDYNKKLVVDGKIGKASLSSINMFGYSLMSYIVDECISYYESIVEKNPSQEKFLKGWLFRAKRVPV